MTNDKWYWKCCTKRNTKKSESLTFSPICREKNRTEGSEKSERKFGSLFFFVLGLIVIATVYTGRGWSRGEQSNNVTGKLRWKNEHLWYTIVTNSSIISGGISINSRGNSVTSVFMKSEIAFPIVMETVNDTGELPFVIPERSVNCEIPNWALKKPSREFTGPDINALLLPIFFLISERDFILTASHSLDRDAFFSQFVLRSE